RTRRRSMQREACSFAIPLWFRVWTENETAYFVGVGADAFAAPVVFFAFFFLVFFVPDLAGAVAFAEVVADGEVGVEPCASATAENAAITSAATNCFINRTLAGS
ncbi:MAG: hypothetical protein ABI593_15560, partial [Betaproteobacteria bacterium]